MNNSHFCFLKFSHELLLDFLPYLLAILGVRGDRGSEEKMERLGLLALPPVPPPPVHSPLPCPSILRGLVMRPAATPAEAEARGRGSTMRISWQASTTPSHESEARSKGGQWHEHLAGTRQDGKTQESWGALHIQDNSTCCYFSFGKGKFRISAYSQKLGLLKLISNRSVCNGAGK